MRGAWRGAACAAVILLGATAYGQAAAPVDPQALLDQESGWRFEGSHRGVRVYSRPWPAEGLTALMGVVALPPGLTPDAVMAAIADVDRAEEVSDGLLESRVIVRQGREQVFLQVLGAPAWAPVSDRYWVLRARTEWNVDGVPGHHRRRWDRLPRAEWPPGLAAEIERRFPGAVEVPMSHGSWETRPAAGGGFELVYRNLSRPGGELPLALHEALSRRTLPGNMLAYLEAARVRSGP